MSRILYILFMFCPVRYTQMFIEVENAPRVEAERVSVLEEEIHHSRSRTFLNRPCILCVPRCSELVVCTVCLMLQSACRSNGIRTRMKSKATASEEVEGFRRESQKLTCIVFHDASHPLHKVVRWRLLCVLVSAVSPLHLRPVRRGYARV